MKDRPSQLGLTERLDQGPVVCAEGYLFEFERRGYLQAGAYVPEIVLDHPELVSGLHREFVHAGSDVVPAFTYYGHREKLRMVGKEDLLEPLNRQALALAVEVATEAGVLSAGDLCNTNVFGPDRASQLAARSMFEEQMSWIADAGVDFVVAETFSYGAEALIALESIQEAGLPAVVTLAVHQAEETREGWSPEEACRRLADAGAAVVGLNCIRGPRTMLPLIERIRAAVDVHVAALPVPYRTTSAQPSFQSLRDPDATVCPTGGRFRRRWTRSPATGMRSPSSPRRRTGSASIISGSAVARDRTTSGRWPRPWGRFRQPAATAPTCPSTRSWAAMSGSTTTTASSLPSSDVLSRYSRAGHTRRDRAYSPVYSPAGPAARNHLRRTRARRTSPPPLLPRAAPTASHAASAHDGMITAR